MSLCMWWLCTCWVLQRGRDLKGIRDGKVQIGSDLKEEPMGGPKATVLQRIISGSVTIRSLESFWHGQVPWPFSPWEPSPLPGQYMDGTSLGQADQLKIEISVAPPGCKFMLDVPVLHRNFMLSFKLYIQVTYISDRHTGGRISKLYHF